MEHILPGHTTLSPPSSTQRGYTERAGVNFAQVTVLYLYADDRNSPFFRDMNGHISHHTTEKTALWGTPLS